MKAAGVTDYTNQTPQPFRMKNVQVQRKIFFKCAQNRRYTCSMHEWLIIMQSLNNKDMKTVRVTDYTN